MRPTTVDRGSATSEMVLVVPVAVLLVLFVALGGRAGESSTAVRHAADQGARAASMVSFDRMPETAERAVRDDLARSGHVCSDTSVAVTVDPSGRLVTVSVECTLDTGGLGPLGSTMGVLRGVSSETIDRYRADGVDPR